MNSPIIERVIRDLITKNEGELSEADLEKVEKLDLSGSQITNEDLKELSGLRNLKELCLDNTAITNQGLKELISMRQLKNVSLRGTGVTEADITTQLGDEIN